MKMKRTWRMVTLLMMKWKVVTATIILHDPASPAAGTIVTNGRAATPSLLPMPATHTGQAPHALHLGHLDANHDEWDASLSAALTTLIAWQLSQCSLVVAADTDYLASTILQTLAHLPNQKQVGKK